MAICTFSPYIIYLEDFVTLIAGFYWWIYLYLLVVHAQIAWVARRVKLN